MGSINENYAAQGIKFGPRCDMATESLKMLKNQVAKMYDEELVYRQQQSESRKNILNSFEEPARSAVKPLFEKMDEDMNECGSQIYQVLWDGGIGIIRAAFGSDAVDLVLEALKRENPLD
ncbi:MAG: hypothetical protein WCS97_01570 [Candidatus Paceibacterota bacterium]|jgi:hypothetical protein